MVNDEEMKNVDDERVDAIITLIIKLGTLIVTPTQDTNLNACKLLETQSQQAA